MIDISLPNRTASEKRSNDRFEEYLRYTKTDYKAKAKNDTLDIQINDHNESEKSCIENALDLYVTCGQNRQIAYGW